MVRLYHAAMIAERFHISPTQALDDLENDPHELGLLALTLLNYGAAKADFDNPKGAKNSPWKDSPVWDRVIRTSHRIATEE